ncbi:17583_t:CDS:2 [Entrophospora sp. SA101]|nr:17583_t:CDS:2 [Entrophospora sp. SA101]
MAGKQSPIIYPMTVPTLTPSIILTILFLSTSSLHLYRMIKFRRPIYSYLFAFSFVRLLLFIVRTAWSTIYHSITLNIITRVLLVGGFFIIIEALYTLLTDWLIITLIGETSTSNYNHNNEEGDAIIPKFTKYTIKFIKLPSDSRNLYVIYNRFCLKMSYGFSTNHAEFGEHIHFRENKPDPGSIFGVPLMRENIIFQELPDGQLANYNALPVMDLWGDLVTFDGLLRRGHHLQSNVSLCSPPDKDDDPTFDPSDLLCINPIEKRKALAESQKYKRDLNIMLRVFQEVKDFAEKNEKNMGPRKFIRTFLKILNGTFVPPPIIFNDRNDSNYILTDVDQYDDNKLIAGSNGGFNQDISNSLLVDGGNALTQAVNNNILTEANTNTTIMDEDNQIAQKVETKYKEQIKPLRIYEEMFNELLN